MGVDQAGAGFTGAAFGLADFPAQEAGELVEDPAKTTDRHRRGVTPPLPRLPQLPRVPGLLVASLNEEEIRLGPLPDAPWRGTTDLPARL
ncbi:hypothetical protein [Streptomyces sp. NPDC085529]|uniref:hypothetical protein n=1 Tax=Streptomyces sp. NPDC085529 TaxID=3365729 RepID=UPI0037D519FD